jgi:hypothetical protein
MTISDTPTPPAYIVIQRLTGPERIDRMSWLIAVIAAWAGLNLLALALLARIPKA